VDETRELERIPTWANPDEYAECVAQSYRRDFWNQQPHRVHIWSEKGTVRGLLAPVLDKLAVGFLPVHGFSSATAAHDIAEDDDGRDLVVFYVGDFDPSGMFMSEQDLPARFAKYDGDHIKLRRIALTREQGVDCRLSRHPIRRRTRATDGSYAITGVVVGNSMRWTRTISATALKRPSWN
jgi:hypothetical protein